MSARITQPRDPRAITLPSKKRWDHSRTRGANVDVHRTHAGHKGVQPTTFQWSSRLGSRSAQMKSFSDGVSLCSMTRAGLGLIILSAFSTGGPFCDLTWPSVVLFGGGDRSSTADSVGVCASTRVKRLAVFARARNRNVPKDFALISKPASLNSARISG